MLGGCHRKTRFCVGEDIAIVWIALFEEISSELVRIIYLRIYPQHEINFNVHKCSCQRSN